MLAINVNYAHLELAGSMGADLLINPVKYYAPKIIQDKMGGAHAAVVTAMAVFNSAVGCVRAGGRVAAVGLPPESMGLSILRLVLEGIQVAGSLAGMRKDLKEALQFAAKGKVAPKVSKRREKYLCHFRRDEAG